MQYKRYAIAIVAGFVLAPCVVHAASTVQNFGENTTPITASINKAGRIVGNTIDHYWDITYRPIAAESGAGGKSGPVSGGIVAKTTVKPEDPEAQEMFGTVGPSLGGRVEMASAQAADSAKFMKTGSNFPGVSVATKIQDPVEEGMQTRAKGIKNTVNTRTDPRTEAVGSCATCGD